jgi:hypothetical protein
MKNLAVNRVTYPLPASRRAVRGTKLDWRLASRSTKIFPPGYAPLSALQVGLSGELNSIARLASRSTKIMPADTSPSPPFRGEREGPDPQGWEGEVGGATNRLVGPPHPTLSPRPAGGEGKGRVVRATLRQQIFEKPVITLSPDSPALQGGREEPVAQRGEGEVGGSANRLVGPPHPALSPRPAGGEDKRRVVGVTLRWQTFKKAVLTLCPDSPAPAGGRGAPILGISSYHSHAGAR